MKFQRYRLDPQHTAYDDHSSASQQAGLSATAGSPLPGTFKMIRNDRFTVARIGGPRGKVNLSVSDRIVFIFVSRGQLRLSAPQNRFVASDGSIFVVFPGIEDVVVSSDAPVEAMSFSFDLLKLGITISCPSEIDIIHPTSQFFLGCYRLLSTLLSLDSTDSDDPSSALNLMLEGTAKGLMSYVQRPSDSLLDEAMRFIAHRHTEPALTPLRIAEQLGVSRSTLNRAFAGHDLGVAAQLRLHRAHTAVSLQTGDPSLSLAEIAGRAGFGSVDSLQRALNQADLPNSPEEFQGNNL